MSFQNSPDGVIFNPTFRFASCGAEIWHSYGICVTSVKNGCVKVCGANVRWISCIQPVLQEILYYMCLRCCSNLFQKKRLTFKIFPSPVCLH
ncbi:hypothetical protein Barb4_02427 [Bacteroidales bacterium Barb4]|nr:hypothetical protein Barb4_02427 [Bacteroidales bacterium Barb4]